MKPFIMRLLCFFEHRLRGWAFRRRDTWGWCVWCGRMLPRELDHLDPTP